MINADPKEDFLQLTYIRQFIRVVIVTEMGIEGVEVSIFECRK